MRRYARFAVTITLASLPVWSGAGAAGLPNIVVLATGGTIAGVGNSGTRGGYEAGRLGVDQLIEAVPQARQLANLRGEQFASIGSQDMTDALWLRLARRANELLPSPDVDGLVITHGTDTIEETAYFLNLVIKSAKPVVMTAAMRPATSLSADGPLNFYDAVAVAAHPDARGRGVLVVVNDGIHGAATLTKTSTTAVQTFFSPLRGLIGEVNLGRVEFFQDPHRRHTLQSEFSVEGVSALPRVDIIYAHADMPADLIDAAVAAGARGLVIAGLGNGNMNQVALAALARASKLGVVCVRSSRVATGQVLRNVEVDDDALGFVAADELNPPKARVLLKLALLKPRPLHEVQRLFETY
jgi:L-asparaginase